MGCYVIIQKIHIGGVLSRMALAHIMRLLFLSLFVSLSCSFSVSVSPTILDSLVNPTLNISVSASLDVANCTVTILSPVNATYVVALTSIDNVVSQQFGTLLVNQSMPIGVWVVSQLSCFNMSSNDISVQSTNTSFEHIMSLQYIQTTSLVPTETQPSLTSVQVNFTLIYVSAAPFQTCSVLLTTSTTSTMPFNVTATLEPSGDSAMSSVLTLPRAPLPTLWFVARAICVDSFLDRVNLTTNFTANTTYVVIPSLYQGSAGTITPYVYNQYANDTVPVPLTISFRIANPAVVTACYAVITPFNMPVVFPNVTCTPAPADQGATCVIILFPPLPFPLSDSGVNKFTRFTCTVSTLPPVNTTVTPDPAVFIPALTLLNITASPPAVNVTGGAVDMNITILFNYSFPLYGCLVSFFLIIRISRGFVRVVFLWKI